MPLSDRIRRPWFRFPAILGSIVVLSGCVHPDFGTRTRLDLSGPVLVDVSTFAGDVNIRSTGDAPGEPYVYVKPMSKYAAHRHDEGRARLSDIDWSVEVSREQDPPVIRVRASTFEHEQQRQRLHVTVSAPSIEGVRVRTRLGDIDVDRASGPMDLETTDGDIDILADRPLDGPLTAVTTDGDIQLRTPPGTRGRLDFFTGDGRVVSRITRGSTRVQGRNDDRSFQAVLNEGLEPFVLRTNDGMIRFMVKPSPRAQSSQLLD